jgi:CTP synthase
MKKNDSCGNSVKFIFVTGGVLSGLGKGVAAASIGRLLSDQYKVVAIKNDGYLNVDPGTMNPVEHGEVFVLDDGTEVDMDFGHYERFLNTTCTGRQNLTMGKVFHELYEKERKGEFLGKTVQFVPHATDHIQSWWQEVAKDADVCLVEIGGTVGDMENELYLEAARSLAQDVGKNCALFVHLTYVPVPYGVNEQKSKPTQQSVAMLMQRGISPDIILCRGPEPVAKHIQKKISVFCNIPTTHVLSATDVKNIYEIPLLYEKQGMVDLINTQLGLDAKPDTKKWAELVRTKPEKQITIAIAGKYTALEDSYASVVEAISHAAANEQVRANVTWIDTEAITNQITAKKALDTVDAVIVPGGFGSRGIDGKLETIRYCRESQVPYLGICYGMQLACVEFMRNVVGKTAAHTTEIDEATPDPVITLLESQKNVAGLGGTLRLGAYPATLTSGSVVSRLYAGAAEIYERHRHRYEVNPKYHDVLQNNGMLLSGLSPDKRLAEFIELPDHDYFVATQAHPELKSNLVSPAPLFVGLIKAASKRS